MGSELMKGWLWLLKLGCEMDSEIRLAASEPSSLAFVSISSGSD